MSKHTPGPWVFDKAHRVGFIVHKKNYGYIVGTQDEEGRYGAIESEANARLISAAPDLLEVLEKVQAWMDGGDDDELAYEIDLALTKAKGE